MKTKLVSDPEWFGLYLIAGRVGENCTLPIDCTAVIPDSACVQETCACLGDTIPSPDRYVCRLPIVGDPCDRTEVCKYIRPISFCRAESQLCDCQYVFHTPRDPYTCVLRKLGDPVGKTWTACPPWNTPDVPDKGVIVILVTDDILIGHTVFGPKNLST